MLLRDISQKVGKYWHSVVNRMWEAGGEFFDVGPMVPRRHLRVKYDEIDLKTITVFSFFSDAF